MLYKDCTIEITQDELSGMNGLIEINLRIKVVKPKKYEKKWIKENGYLVNRITGSRIKI